MMKEYYEQTQKKWEEPGKCEVKDHETFISTHPGEDRDSDSEEEGESGGNKQQLPVPIQDEVIGEVQEEVEEAEMQEEEERAVEGGDRVCDSGEAENDG